MLPIHICMSNTIYEYINLVICQSKVVTISNTQVTIIIQHKLIANLVLLMFLMRHKDLLCKNRTVIEDVMVSMYEELHSSMITVDTKINN